MTAIIKLEDGRALYFSTFGMMGAYGCIADAVTSERPALARWLNDVSKRSAPFLDFDIRGLTPEDRAGFWAGAERSLAAIASEFGLGFLKIPNMYAANCLDQLLKMRASILAGEPPLSLSSFDHVFEFDGQEINLAELWFETNGEED